MAASVSHTAVMLVTRTSVGRRGTGRIERPGPH